MEQIRRRDGRVIVLFDGLLSALGGLNAVCMMMRDGTRCEVFVFIIIFMVDFFSLAGLVHYYSFFLLSFFRPLVCFRWYSYF